MIIEFSLGNYRSFNGIQKINFRSTGLVSEDQNVDLNNIVDVAGHKLLKTIGVYGSNGSGKSNLLKGLLFFKQMVKSSLNSENILEDGIHSFKLTDQISQNDGFFQINIILDNEKFRYGFSLKDNIISSEWLFGTVDGKEVYFFKRTIDQVDANNEQFPEGLNLPYDKLRSNALFLSFCASYDGIISTNVKNFISLKIINDESNSRRQLRRQLAADNANSLTDNLIKNGQKELVLNWLKDAGLNLKDIQTKNVVYGEVVLQQRVVFIKNKVNSNGEVVGLIKMDLQTEESTGTQKYYSYIGRLQQLFLEGGVFLSDEIDGNFHPSLLRKIVSLFNNPQVNIANAQLLFTSHDTNLMDAKIMRRDQFYFTEKSLFDATVLYSLSDLKNVNNNADFARQYLAGYYGALPILGNFLNS